MINKTKMNITVNMEDYGFSGLRKDDGDKLASLENLSLEERETLASVGVKFDKDDKTGGYLLYNKSVFSLLPRIEGLEIMPIAEALEKVPEVREKYYFKLVGPDMDEYTKAIAESAPRGFFIRVKKGVKIEQPVNAGLFMHKEMSSMSVHNIVVLEEGAQLHLITGCAAACTIRKGLHVAMTESYVGKDAKLVSTMVHNWGPDFIVRPRGGTLVEDNGSYVSNYYSVRPPKHIEMNPYTRLKGANSKAKYMSALVCLPDTFSEIGGTVLMDGEGSGAELVARTVNHGGTIIQTGLLIGAAKDVRAHVDCSGLMMGDSGVIEAVPGLRSMHPDARMSHEAAIGKIDMGEVNYLQSKGLNEMQAIALIVRGFLDIGVEMEGLAPELEKTIKEISELSGHGEA